MQRGLLRGIAAFRWGAWVWMTAVVALNRDDLERPWLAWGLVGATLAYTAAATILLRRSPETLVRFPAVATELALATALGVAGGIAYAHTNSPDDAFSSVRTMGFAWPLMAIMSAGVAYGPVTGILAGIGVAAPRWIAPVVNGISIEDYEATHFYSLVSTTILYALAGGVAGYAANLLRRAEHEVAAARAREEVARTLHDGVLQTLAVIERRSDDPALARLAREQERDLRNYLFGSGPTAERGGAADLGPALRSAAARFEDSYGGRVEVVLAPDLPHLETARADALAGAVGEALANAGKHGDATRVTVYAEPDRDGGVACSVRDDGRGFDRSTVPEGVGLRRSIRGRMEEVGGRVEIDSRPGGGTEVRLWIP